MSKKGYTLAAILAGCLAAGAAQAQTDQYARLQAAISDVDGFSDGLTAVATIGAFIPQVDKNFSIEGELTKSISDPDTSVAGYDLSVSYFTLAAYAVYTLPVNQKIDFYGRAGALYESVEAEYYHPLVGKTTADDDDFGLSLGVGTDIALTKNMDFTAGITLVEEDINHYSAGIRIYY
jgi:hypothetical protein